MPFMEDLCPLHIEIVFPIFRSTDYQGGVSNWIIEAISKDLKKKPDDRYEKLYKARIYHKQKLGFSLNAKHFEYSLIDTLKTLRFYA